MVAQFVRLKLTLLGNTFKRSIWQTIGVVLGLLYALSMVGLIVAGAVVGGWQNPELTGEILVIGGALVVGVWLLLPIFFYGVDATLDPQRFALYPIPRRTLLAGLTLAGIFTVPGIATVLAVAGTSLAWLRHPAALVAALIGGVLAVAVCIVGSRAITTVLAPVLEGRRSRDLFALVGVAALMGISPLANWFGGQFENGTMTGDQARSAVRDLATFLGWTPLGAPWGMASSVYDGDWVAAGLRFLVAAATVAALGVLWAWALRRSLERPARAAGGTERVRGLGFLGRFPATPTGAVAARAATYWLRDPRYSSSLLVVPMMPVIMYFAGSSGGGEAMGIMLGVAPLVAWILGFTIVNDVGADYTAFALHVATGVPGRADRWGRALPVLVAGAPIVAAMTVVAVWLTGHWEWLVTLLGLALGGLALSTGVSAYSSARLVYPVAKPGESPFKTPPGATGATMVAQFASMGITVLLSLPALGMTVWALVGGSALVGWIAAAVGLASGVAVLLGGVRLGARTMDRRSPELLQQVMAWA